MAAQLSRVPERASTARLARLAVRLRRPGVAVAVTTVSGVIHCLWPLPVQETRVAYATARSRRSIKARRDPPQATLWGQSYRKAQSTSNGANFASNLRFYSDCTRT